MTARVKLKTLEQRLQTARPFENPNVNYEQYTTPAHIASHMLYTMQSSYGDIEDKFVADLGCGCGILSLGCAILGASYVIGFDADESVMPVYAENMEDFHQDGIVCDLFDSDIRQRCRKAFDVVVTNPPFGVRRKGADLEFVKIGSEMARDAVYSLHKTATRKHVLDKAREWGVKCKVLAELRYDLPQTYKFHKKKSVDIAVDFYRFWDLNGK